MWLGTEQATRWNTFFECVAGKLAIVCLTRNQLFTLMDQVTHCTPSSLGAHGEVTGGVRQFGAFQRRGTHAIGRSLQISSLLSSLRRQLSSDISAHVEECVRNCLARRRTQPRSAHFKDGTRQALAIISRWVRVITHMSWCCRRDTEQEGTSAREGSVAMPCTLRFSRISSSNARL